MPDVEVAGRCKVCSCYVDQEDLFCPNCGAENEATVEPAPPTELVISFTCDSCGASMRYDAQERALRCPFCGSTRVTRRPPRREITPQQIAPARINRSQAEKILRKWLSTGFWRPSDASTASRIAEMRGVYVPFWCFSARTRTRWTADTSPPPLGCRGDWYPVAGKFSSEYAQILIPASSALTQAETAAIGPFDLEQAVDPEQFSPRGWIIESFRLSRRAVRPLARATLERLELHRAAARLNARAYRNLHVNVRIEGLVGQPVLLPVWILAYRYRNKLRRVLINAQTGKITGQAPFSYLKLLVIILLAILVLGLLLLVALVGTAVQ